MTRIRRRLAKLGLGYLQIEAPGSSAKDLRAAERVVDKLIDDSQVDVLRALMDGRVALAELIDLDRRNQLSGAAVLANVALQRPLWATWEDLLPAMSPNVRTQKRYGVTRLALQRKAKAWLPSDATVQVLRLVPWRELRAAWGASGSDWNHVRRGVSRFLSVLFDDKHAQFRHDVVKLIPIAKETQRVPDLTVATFWAVLEHARADVKAAFATLVITGMRVGEYLACTESSKRARTCTVVIPSGKTGEGVVSVDEELWPWVEQGIPSPFRYKVLRLRWVEACEAAGVKDVTLHDLRHCHGQWATDAGADLSAVKSMLRHGSLSMSERYTRRKQQTAGAKALAKAIGGGK